MPKRKIRFAGLSQAAIKNIRRSQKDGAYEPESFNGKYMLITNTLIGQLDELDDADNLPDTNNEVRAWWAARCVREFMTMTGVDPEDAIGDLVANLMHLARLTDQDPELQLMRGQAHFYAEEKEEQDDA